MFQLASWTLNHLAAGRNWEERQDIQEICDCWAAALLKPFGCCDSELQNGTWGAYLRPATWMPATVPLVDPGG